MKFSTSSGDFLKKLQVAAGAIGGNPVIPILEDFLFSIKENNLTITATNLETTIITSMDVMADEDGQIAIPAKILVDTLKALPEQPITVAVEEKGYNVEITSSYGKYKLAGDNPEDFPSVPEKDAVESVSMSGETLLNAINKTLFATSNDEVRLAMMGVYMVVDFNKITFVATDAHKLVKYAFKNVSSDVSASIILPKKSLSLLKNSLSVDGEVDISFNKSNAFFTFEDTAIVCRLIDAKYPDYDAVIPTDNANILTLNTADFQNSLKRIAIYANKTTNQVVLNIQESSLTISAQDLDFSNEATEQMPCSYDGEPMSIGFNARFLIEMLNVIGSDDVTVKLSKPNRAGIMHPVDGPENEELLMLIMPVMMSH